MSSIADLVKHGVVPDVLPQSFVPAAGTNLRITFIAPGGTELHAHNGVHLTPTQVQRPPAVEFEKQPGQFYTVVMTDPDAPSRQDPKFREWRHWTAMNISAENPRGDEVAAYVGSGPPQGTGYHRYVIAVLRQTHGKIQDMKQVPHIKFTAEGRGKWKLQDFAHQHHLELIAADFYQAQFDASVPKLFEQLSAGKRHET